MPRLPRYPIGRPRWAPPPEDSRAAILLLIRSAAPSVASARPRVWAPRTTPDWLISAFARAGFPALVLAVGLLAVELIERVLDRGRQPAPG